MIKFFKKLFFNRLDTFIFWVAIISTLFIDEVALKLVIWCFIVMPFFVISEIKDYIDEKLGE